MQRLAPEPGSSAAAATSAPTSPATGATLSMAGDRLMLHRPGHEAIPVRVVYLRPISDPKAVALMDEKHHEVLRLDSIEVLEPASRRLAERALAERYLLLRIQRVSSAEAQHHARWFTVETDRGPRRFCLREASKNVSWQGDDQLVLRDTMGNRYQIASLRALDAASRAHVLRVV